MGDQVEQGGASPLRCCGDGGSEKGFVVELGGIAVIQLEDAVFADGVGNRRRRRSSSSPSRVGVEAGRGLGHRTGPNKPTTLRAGLHAAGPHLDHLTVLLPAAVERIEVGGTHQALVALSHRLKQQLLPVGIEFGEHIVEQ